MSLFKSAIQTLSQMAIQEAGVAVPQKAEQSLLEDVQMSLSQLPLLNEDESRFSPEMVVVKTSNRLGRYLIEMEDLSRYMITNNLVNVAEAVGNILEVNDLQGQFANVAIVVDEQSINEDMEELGYAVSGAMQTPPKGLGLAMIGKQEDFSKLRRIANTKQMMDVLTGRYGLPLIKKNYSKVGFLEAAQAAKKAAEEDVQLKAGDDDKVIHEEPKDDDKASKGKKANDEGNGKDFKDDAAKEDKPKYKDTGKKDDCADGSDNEAGKTEQPGDEDPVQESAIFGNMTPHEMEIQRIRDIAAGKYDDQFI